MSSRSDKARRVALCLGMACLVILTALLIACGDDSSSTPLHAPKFLVALDDTSSADNVNIFKVDTTTGVLTAVTNSPFTTGLIDGAAAVVHPKHGNWVFAADWNGNVQSLVLGADGTPTVASTANSGYSNFGWVNGLAVSADGKYLYSVTDGTDVVAWSIDQSTGALTKIGAYTTPTLTCTYAVATAGSYVYIVDDCSFTVQVAKIGSDGSLSDVQTVAVPPTAYYLWTLAVDKTGKFLYVGDESATLSRFTISSDGKLNYKGQTVRNSADGDMDSISFSADNKFLYTTTDRTGTAVFSIDQSTGDLTEITASPFGTEDSYGSVVVDPSSKFVYVSDDSSQIVAYKRNQKDGTLSPLTGATPTTYTTKYTSSYGFAVSW